MVSPRHRRRLVAGGERLPFAEAYAAYGGRDKFDKKLVALGRDDLERPRQLALELFGVEVGAGRRERWTHLLLWILDRRITNREMIAKEFAGMCDATTISRDLHELADRGFLVDPNFLGENRQEAWVAVCEPGRWRLRKAILTVHGRAKELVRLRALNNRAAEGRRVLGRPATSNPPIERVRQGLIPRWLYREPDWVRPRSRA
ncbi:MAG: hypothetical protein QOD81_4650 [Solirubrobacteraceae bacterium]|jgi:hypothetical protein|nr:hypothetical protein [Solirubrobacteraceae bacterium]